jgi:hypothetical protein
MTLDPKRYIIDAEAEVSDIDLDDESFVLPDGSRLTERRAAEILERRKANLIPGRKSLGRDGSHSPTVQFRTPRKAEAEELAHELGITPSELARRALHQYLDQLHPPKAS